MDIAESIREEDLQPGDTVRLEGIDWDADGDDPSDLGLPMATDITIPSDWCEGESVADLLSDKYGFCVHGVSTILRT